jgi:ankyrin repeat protein
MNDDTLSAWLTEAGFDTGHPDPRIANGMTLLMHAARHGQADVVRSLLARGAAANALNADGNGALWFACFADCGDCIDALVAAGAHLDNQNVNGATALIYCASAGKSERVRQLLGAGASLQPRTLDDYGALDSCANRECLNLLRAASRP